MEAEESDTNEFSTVFYTCAFTDKKKLKNTYKNDVLIIITLLLNYYYVSASSRYGASTRTQTKNH